MKASFVALMAVALVFTSAAVVHSLAPPAKHRLPGDEPEAAPEPSDWLAALGLIAVFGGAALAIYFLLGLI